MTNLESKKWECKSVIFDGEDFFIKGLNIWDYKWELTGRKVTVKDPEYKKTFNADIFKIQFNQTQIEFVAVEFSNCVWGIYQSE
jgi:hypothetical protein